MPKDAKKSRIDGKQKPIYKTESEVVPSDKKEWIVAINGQPVTTGLPLVHAREVRLNTPQKLVDYSNESAHNKATARRNAKTGRTLEKGIQLYRLWFRFLQLALELEAMDAEIVVKGPTWIKNAQWLANQHDADIPQEVIDRADGGRIFRCRTTRKVKVNRAAYDGWDLDQVATGSFDRWWRTHSNLFEGLQPAFITSKRDMTSHPDHLYIRIDKTSQWRDIVEFMRTEVSKQIKGKRATFAISGKNPRAKVIQNNYNALVLRLKGWLPERICSDRNTYLRRTDETSDARTKSERLTVPTAKDGKLLYSTLVSKQRDLAIWHLLEVCEGRFGTSMNA
jgi:hypothetical protein